VAADVVDPSFISAGAGFLGAIVGAGAALWSQFITQNAITERERRERTRKERRVRALFTARLEQARDAVGVAANGLTWGTQIADAYAPLATIADDASFMLCLMPNELSVVAEAVKTLKANYAFATAALSEHEQKLDKANSSNEREALEKEKQKNLRAIYSSGREAFSTALVEFGCKRLP
jgi:hypothetical protein